VLCLQFLKKSGLQLVATELIPFANLERFKLLIGCTLGQILEIRIIAHLCFELLECGVRDVHCLLVSLQRLHLSPLRLLYISLSLRDFPLQLVHAHKFVHLVDCVLVLEQLLLLQRCLLLVLPDCLRASFYLHLLA